MKKDKDKLTEEEQKALEELKQALENDPEFIRRRRIALMFSYGLHHHFLVHILLMLIVNILLISALLGIPHFGVVHDPWLYLLCAVLFTFVELSIKMIITRLLQVRQLYSVGLVDVLMIPAFYMSFVYPKAIVFDHVWQIISFVVLFYVIKFVTTYYIKKYFYRRRNQ